MKKLRQQMNLMKLVERFHSEENCREYLEGLRWPNGIECPRCGSEKISRSYTRNQYDCNLSCGYQFSVTSGTMMHDTHLPLRKWLVAAYLMIEAKKGVSANQLKRTIDVSYKTAWYLCHRIRAAMTEAYPVPLKGIVEVDETWVGGKVKGMGRGYKGNKAIVVGAAQRDGKIVLKVVQDRSRKTLHEFIRETTAPETEAIYTDDWGPYRGIADHDTRHETVNHSIGEYVRGKVHTNTIENVWSLLQRSIIGSYHKVSIKHLDAYLDELEWRFNNRDNPWLFRDTLLKLLKAEHLEYEELVQ
ncbi:MAG: IS1595 family transposase [Chloroflexi bacterium]|nr:IS1595 family transposase [Chloroflexota bacterium]